MQLYRYFAVHTDRAAEIREFRFGIFRQVSEQPDKRGRVYVRPVFGEPGCLRVVPVREILVVQVLVACGEHDPDLLVGCTSCPFAFGREEVVASADDFRYVGVAFHFREDVCCNHTPVGCRMGQAGFQFVTCVQFHIFCFYGLIICVSSVGTFCAGRLGGRHRFRFSTSNFFRSSIPFTGRRRPVR